LAEEADDARGGNPSGAYAGSLDALGRDSCLGAGPVYRGVNGVAGLVGADAHDVGACPETAAEGPPSVAKRATRPGTARVNAEKKAHAMRSAPQRLADDGSGALERRAASVLLKFAFSITRATGT